MKSFNQYLDDVGMDRIAECPLAIYEWYAYRAGECKKFQTLQDAKQYSSNTERVVVNQKEQYEFWENRRHLERQAFENWYSDLCQEYGDLSTDMFELCYSEAYDRGHAYGYDEVAARLSDVVNFAESLISIYKGSL